MIATAAFGGVIALVVNCATLIWCWRWLSRERFHDWPLWQQAAAAITWAASSLVGAILWHVLQGVA